MKYISLSFFVGILIGSILFAQDRNIEFTEYDLDNGLHVILHEDHSTPIVAVSVLYHVGSKDEYADRTGFAHFFEHLMFEGSEHIPRGDYMKIVRSAGGTLNANTSFDRTYYYEVLPSNQLKLALWLESERLLHAKVDSIGVETQRDVVKEERAQRIDNQPYGSILQEIFKRAYKEYPYQWTPIGNNQYIDEAALEEFMDFYKKYYVPENATLTIAGDLDPEQTKQWIQEYFGEIPAGGKEIPRVTIEEPPLGGEVRDTIPDNIQLPAVIQAYRIPSIGTDDYYAVDMLNTLLAQGQSSRFVRSLVDEKQLALQVFAQSLPLEGPNLSFAFAIANAGVAADAVEEVMNEEIEKAKNELMPEKEFQKLRNQVENDFISSNASMAGIAESLANYHVYYGDANLINTELERYMKVSREDIQRVAKDYFKPENRVVLYYLPKTE